MTCIGKDGKNGNGRDASPELQVRGGIEDNPKIFFLISQQKHTVFDLFSALCAKLFQSGGKFLK